MSALLAKGGAEIYEVFYLTPELSFMSMANMNKLENILVLKGRENEKWARTREWRETVPHLGARTEKCAVQDLAPR